MTLVVEVPSGYEPERRYILDVVLSDWLGLEWRLRQSALGDVRIALAEDPDGPAVVLPDVLFATPPDQWLTPASLPAVRRAADGLPVLYGSDAGIDVLGSAFFMLTRYEELAITTRDRYGRFPAQASLAAQAGFLGVPVVDAYVERLWDALVATWPRLERAPRAFALALSHDIDHPLATLDHGPRDAVRQLGGDLLVRRDPRLATRRLRSLMGNPDLDPNNTFDFLMEVSERHGLRSAFYFLAHRHERPREGAYLFEHPWVRSLIGRIGARGHEIGIHPSHCTHRDAERTREELARLRRVAEDEGVHQERWGGRQHFLRWANPETWRNYEAAGLSYDSTLAYAEAIGFRSGTCHPYRAFDLEVRRPLDLHEHPFQVMDVTLLSSMALAGDAARAAVLEIAAQCRRYRGCFGVLWHNNTLLRTARERHLYESMVAAILAS
ncbi:MAG TPA: polysaccharide deacetylase family protein [Solirubrobacteraceae bacterium]